LTSLVREDLFDKLSAFTALPPHTAGGPGPRRPKQPSRRSDWDLEDPKLAKIWRHIVERLTNEAVRTAYDFDPAMLVAPSGTLDSPIIFGLHWPLSTETLQEYSSMRDMMFNPCI
jgi:hypothetical protein